MINRSQIQEYLGDSFVFDLRKTRCARFKGNISQPRYEGRVSTKIDWRALAFFVLYVEEIDKYLIWDVRNEHIKRQCFSAAQRDVLACNEAICKGVEYKWRKLENVNVVDEAGLLLFFDGIRAELS